MDAPPRRRAARDRGFALLIVLWTLSLLSLLISQVSGSGRQALRLAFNARGHAALQAVTDAAVHEAGFHVGAAGRAHWPADGVEHVLREDGAALSVRVTSEAGLVNPSIASLDLLAAMAQGCGADEHKAGAVASAIVSWRFPTAQTAYGAPAYRAAGLGYAPPGQPFESIDELGLVLGMTPGLLACLAPHLSLYRQADPDPNAADPFVLRALSKVIGTQPPLSDAPADESLVRIDVSSQGPHGARASRQAVLLMQPQTASSGDNANGGGANSGSDGLAPFRILSWTR